MTKFIKPQKTCSLVLNWAFVEVFSIVILAFLKQTFFIEYLQSVGFLCIAILFIILEEMLSKDVRMTMEHLALAK